MITFFPVSSRFIAVQSSEKLSAQAIEKLSWLFQTDKKSTTSAINKHVLGPRKEMISPWSTNAVEITQNMGVNGIQRIEQFTPFTPDYDRMISQEYHQLDQDLFDMDIQPEDDQLIDDIAAYNQQEGLSLSAEEVNYLEKLADQLHRKLTDAEVFGFSQVNSEHCRHKIFNGKFIIDGKTKERSLFQMIKETAKEHPNAIVSAYKDNVAFIKGPEIEQFAPQQADQSSYYQNKSIESIISIKAETHNFPTTVEPFNGAATGSGGEIRDRMAGGIGSIPLAGSAVYMTAYPRFQPEQKWEKAIPKRDYLYQSPLDILIKASNGASDFGNKFGQPLINGSLFTFEHQDDQAVQAYDKTIMLAGGIGFAKQNDAQKKKPNSGDKIVILGGDNYRIGMGGAAVSSADTGDNKDEVELNAVQRSNPEMQKRVANTIRAMSEAEQNFITSIHDHGAGGHLNCLSELVEETGGKIDIDRLPVGDATLSNKEIIGNESQERMGLIIDTDHFELLQRIAHRERSPIYEVGEITDDDRFLFYRNSNKDKPIDLQLDALFGSSPKTIMKDETQHRQYNALSFSADHLVDDIKKVLQLESVACKDWLTNKVDRCVGGRTAQQQCVGKLQLPLSNCGVIALDYQGKHGIATSIGHAPIPGLINARAGAIQGITEALTNIVWAPMENGIKNVSLSANWMWPCNNPGEDARLYEAVEAASEFTKAIGINIPTGKDSLSMKQKYKDHDVLAPGTVVISASAHSNDIQRIVHPVMKSSGYLYYIDWSDASFALGGTAFSQTMAQLGQNTGHARNPDLVVRSFNCIQKLIKDDKIIAGHDISSGGFITTLLEMCFPDQDVAAQIDLSSLSKTDVHHLFFHENAGVIIQTREKVDAFLSDADLNFYPIGHGTASDRLEVKVHEHLHSFDIETYRRYWFQRSYLFDRHQTKPALAKERFDHLAKSPLQFKFPLEFNGKVAETQQKVKAAIIREKGSNSEREMAKALDLSGFEVKDIHMTDLMSGKEDLTDVQFIATVGGFSNSDVLGSAKGWAGSFRYNKKARKALYDFFARKDTLSLGVCNGCQLFIELGLITPDDEQKPKLLNNKSGKFECIFSEVVIQENHSVMLKSLAGSRLGIWSAHAEGRFNFPYLEDHYQIVGKYAYANYPQNPNGSDFNACMLTDDSGRHLVMMPHLERSTFPWNWPYYPEDRNDVVSPWLVAFQNAHQWLLNK